MKPSHAAVAIACLALAAAALPGTATRAGAAPVAAASTVAQAPGAWRFERARPRCARSERSRAAYRALEVVARAAPPRRCKRKGAKRRDGAPQATESASDSPLPISAPRWNQGGTAQPATSPVTAPAPPAGQDPSAGPPAPAGEAFRFFSPQSFWNAPLADDAALDPESAAISGAFEATIARELQSGNGPWINTTDYSVPIYTVPADQPTVPVQLANQFYSPSLQAAWREVPLPPDAQASAGSDQHLVLWQPSSDRLWEFWKLTQAGGSWGAGWGGAMRDVSSASGVYDAEAWPGAESWWGSSASSLSIAGGLITFEDLQQGEIDHGLALAIPNVRAGYYTAPAQRTDGTSASPLALPEGARLRLDPELDLAALGLPPLTLMIARAAQRYGIVIRDRAKIAHFFAQDPTPTGTNPYAGRDGYFEGRTPAQLLARFPWSHLQLLAMQLHRWK
jgi:hypothetical protein